MKSEDSGNVTGLKFDNRTHNQIHRRSEYAYSRYAINLSKGNCLCTTILHDWFENSRAIFSSNQKQNQTQS